MRSRFLRPLVDSPWLNVLDLSYTQVDDDAIEILTRMRRLRRLDLRGCAVSDYPLLDVSWPALQGLDLRGTQISEATGFALRKRWRLKRLEFGELETGDD